MEMSEQMKKEKLIENIGKVHGLHKTLKRIFEEKEAIREQLNENREKLYNTKEEKEKELYKRNVLTLDGQMVLIVRLEQWTQTEFNKQLVKCEIK